MSSAMEQQLTPEQLNARGTKYLTPIPPSDSTPDFLRNSSRGQDGFNCFQEAAQAGYAPAQVNLANCFFYGIGTGKDEAKGREWLQKAVDVDFAPAQVLMAELLESGKRGAEQNQAAAYNLYVVASRKAVPPSWGIPADSVDLKTINSKISDLLTSAKVEVVGTRAKYVFPDRSSLTLEPSAPATPSVTG